MQKIVYILGAGFSAPFSIPVSNVFLDKAKDLYEKYPKYSHFKEVIAIIREYHVTKKWYKVDLDNIEDLLSMLEMKRNIENSEDNSKFKKFIVDVVKAYSPSFGKCKLGEVLTYPNQRWDECLFDFDIKEKNNLLAFISALFGINYSINEKPVFKEKLNTNTFKVKSELLEEKPLNCNIISLNYDLIFENALIHLNSFTGFNSKFANSCNNELNYDNVYLAKLHGSVDTDVIPPTWNKYFNENIRNSWGLAYKLLSEANRIIFIGYSLPETDTYIRYLLSLSAINSFNLKNVDIICKDYNNVVFDRYKKFMNFENNRINFYNTTTQHYLQYFYDYRFYYSYDNGNLQKSNFSIGLAHAKFVETNQSLISKSQIL